MTNGIAIYPKLIREWSITLRQVRERLDIELSSLPLEWLGLTKLDTRQERPRPTRNRR